MVASELKTGVSTIRIHDEYCMTATENCISRVSRIVSESYMRRTMNEVDDGLVAAFGPVTNSKKI